MAKGGFFKNYRVYILTSVAYMGALLFGESNSSPIPLSEGRGEEELHGVISALLPPKESLLH